MKKLFYLLGLIAIAACHRPSSSTNSSLELYQLVNPFIGTGGHGHTYPGATAPFGMMQLSPDTRLSGWDGCSAYHYSDSIIYGFSHTHLSGTGVSDYGDLLIMPMTGKGYLNNGIDKGAQNGYASHFLKSSEKAEAGYYQVRLKDYAIDVELTTGQRMGMHRYRFPEQAKKAWVVIDLQHRDQLKSVYLKANGNKEIQGHRISQAWAVNQHFYFSMNSSLPFEIQEQEQMAIADSTKTTKYLLAFDLSESRELILKVGMSAVSADAAQSNMEAEMASDNWDFDALRQKTQQAWNKALSKIEVKGGSLDDQKIFYSALYHNMIVPNLWSDADGRYRGLDGKVHDAKGQDVFTIFSLWDTYRATHPLYNLIERSKNEAFIKTMLLHYQDGGKLPVWELAGNETNCMIGYHSVSVIADAYNKGIKNFDTALALEAMQASAMRIEDPGLKALYQKGFMEMSDNPESVSKNLEYAYDNWCIAQFAKALGQDSIYRDYIRKAQYYKNSYDPNTGFMRARINGAWLSPFSPAEVNFNYTEANSWQYSLYFPQDISGWMALAADSDGAAVLENYLDSLFMTSSNMGGHAQADITGLIGQYAHGNEPSHHMAYLYNYVGKASKTQERVRQILSELYKNAPDGLSGNEDCGQMSAWYIFSAMGFYPVTPGSSIYAMGSPVFDTIRIHQENGHTFEIISKNNSDEDIYVQSLKLNGAAYEKSYLDYKDIAKGGQLVFEMGDKPSNWGSAPNNRPNSSIPQAEQITVVPYFIAATNAFSDSLTVELASPVAADRIYYWIGDEEGKSRAKPYQQPMVIKEESRVFAYAVNSEGQESQVVEAVYRMTDPNRRIQLSSEYADRYAGGGPKALIDGLTGGNDYRSGFWQGFQGQDLKFVVDLGSVMDLSYIALSCLQDQNSWIWTPRTLEFELSVDGEQFNKVGRAKSEIPEDWPHAATEKLGLRLRKKARYIRVAAQTIGQCPEWHKGAGGNAWIFADELIVE